MSFLFINPLSLAKVVPYNRFYSFGIRSFGSRKKDVRDHTEQQIADLNTLIRNAIVKIDNLQYQLTSEGVICNNKKHPQHFMDVLPTVSPDVFKHHKKIHRKVLDYNNSNLNNDGTVHQPHH